MPLHVSLTTSHAVLFPILKLEALTAGSHHLPGNRLLSLASPQEKFVLYVYISFIE